MDTKFWDNLIFGRQYEEEVASYLESVGYNVWRIGTWRLPIDLFAWKGERELLIEVKFRRAGWSTINARGMASLLGDLAVPVFLIEIHPDSSSVRRFLKNREEELDRDIEEAQAKIPEAGKLRRGALESFVRNLKELKNYFYFSTLSRVSYKEVAWDEIPLYQE